MPLSIIGAGLVRTGTTTLKTALDQLGFGPCHHMIEVVHNPAAIEQWIAVADGRHDWEAVFAGYRSAVDWPEVAFWRELTSFYPEAKVILTERDPEAWFRSTQATIMSPARTSDTQSPMSVMMLKLLRGFMDDVHDHDAMVEAFKAHNAEVKATIAPERLLVYAIADGWAPLSTFLDVPVPDTPFPHQNSTEAFRARFGPGAAPT